MSRRALIAVCALVLGCAHAPSTRSVSQAEAQAQVGKRLDEIWASASQRDFARLSSYHLYGPKFTEFKDGAPRGDAASGEQGERAFFGALSAPKVIVSDLAVNVFGEVAIATFHGDFAGTMEGHPIAAKLPATIVFVQDHDEWKLVHEHFSPLASPAPP
jgi:ketosteroid isomerase-like protein